MKESYQIVGKKETRELAEFLVENGQMLVPMVELVEQSRMAVGELIDALGRAAIEAVLTLSAEKVAGPKHQGRKGSEIAWYGSQAGRIALSERKLRVEKPRLRKKGVKQGGEIPIPAYEAMQDNTKLTERLLDILMRGVSTRNYEKVVPQMAETVGVSRSSVSREFIEASAEQLRMLSERRFDDLDLLIIYIDGLRFAGHNVICAVGVDVDGKKHVLGLRDGATENARVVTEHLEDLVERGVKPGVCRLFVIDGSKALRKAIDAVYGENNPVQRCRNHKVKNVMDHLPEELKDQVKAVMKASYRLEPKEGIARLKKQASWLETEYPSAAASLLEGLEETFTVNRLGLPKTLHRCLCTTNIIENPYSAARLRTRRVTRWRNGEMILRWTASALLASEANFRRLMGYNDLWMLKSALNRDGSDRQKEVA